MSEFWIYTSIGLKHVFDFNAYDHVLFLIVLTVPYLFKDWRKLVLLISLFTLGHTLSLLLSVYEIIIIKAKLVEFLIPITILTTALYTLFTAKKTPKKDNGMIVLIITLFFGAIHGLGFSNYFKILISDANEDKLFPLLEFALGIEVAQIIVVVVLLLLSYILQHFFRVSRRDFILVMSAFVIGVVLPLLLNNEFLNF